MATCDRRSNRREIDALLAQVLKEKRAGSPNGERRRRIGGNFFREIGDEELGQKIKNFSPNYIYSKGRHVTVSLDIFTAPISRAKSANSVKKISRKIASTSVHIVP